MKQEITVTNQTNPCILCKRLWAFVALSLIFPLLLPVLLLWLAAAAPQTFCFLSNLAVLYLWFSEGYSEFGAEWESASRTEIAINQSVLGIIVLNLLHFAFLYIVEHLAFSHPAFPRRGIVLLWSSLVVTYLVIKFSLVEGWRSGVVVLCLLTQLFTCLNQFWLRTTLQRIEESEANLLKSAGIQLIDKIPREPAVSPKKVPAAAYFFSPESQTKRLSYTVSVCWQDEAQTKITRKEAAGLSYLESYHDDDDIEYCWESPRAKKKKMKPKRPSLVIGHGYGGGKAVWAGMVKELAKHFHLYIIDWYGVGLSKRPRFSARSTADAENFFIDALEKWRSELQLTKFYLMGHSLGGYLSGVYALRYPQYIEQLLLLSPAGLPAPPSPTWSHFFLKLYWNNLPPLSLLRFLGPVSLPIGRYFVKKRFASDFEGVSLDYLVDYLYSLNTFTPTSGELALPLLLAPGAWGSWGRDPLGERLKELTIPLSVYYGEYDWMDEKSGESVCAELTKKGISSKFYRVPRAGHQLMFENPQALTQQVLAHLIPDARLQ